MQSFLHSVVKTYMLFDIIYRVLVKQNNVYICNIIKFQQKRKKKKIYIVVSKTELILNWKRKIKTSPGNRICIIPHAPALPIVHSVLPWHRTVPWVSRWPPTVSWPVPHRTRRQVPKVYGPWADRQYSTHPSVQSRPGRRTARTEPPLSPTVNKINSIRLI